MRITVLFGGTSPERDISLITGKNIGEALKRRGHDVEYYDPSERGWSELFTIKTDLVFVALHGVPGECGRVQGLLELAGTPYTGSGPTGSAIGMDKVRTKLLLRGLGLPTPEGYSFSSPQEAVEWAKKLQFPLFVKPSTAGSSIGARIVEKEEEVEGAAEEALRFSPEGLLEEYIPGPDYSVSVVGNRPPEVLEVVRIEPRKEFYSYEAKYDGSSQYTVPAPLPVELKRRVFREAAVIYEKAECYGFARIDFKIRSNGQPVYFEINTIPGMTPKSLLPMAAAYKGIDFDHLIEKIAIWGVELGKRL